MNTPRVSIVIRAKNEARYLPDLLKKIKTQTVTDLEVILVDDHSTDQTVEIAKSGGCQIISLKRPFTYGGSLNEGVEEAKGRFIISVAAHALPLTNTWVEAYLNCFNNDKTAGVYGKQIAGEEANFLEKLERVFNSFIDHNLFQPFFLNTNGCFRRDVWEKVKFDDLVWGLEDHVWSRQVAKLGYKFKYCPEAAVAHHHDKNALASLKRYYNESKIYFGIILGRYK